MRTDFKDPHSPSTHTPPPEKKKENGGCISMFFYLMGIVTIGMAVLGYILSFFDMVIEIYNSKIPKITLEIFIALMVCAGIFLLLGWLTGKLESLIRKKKQKNNP